MWFPISIVVFFWFLPTVEQIHQMFILYLGFLGQIFLFKFYVVSYRSAVDPIFEVKEIHSQRCGVPMFFLGRTMTWWIAKKSCTSTEIAFWGKFRVSWAWGLSIYLAMVGSKMGELENPMVLVVYRAYGIHQFNWSIFFSPFWKGQQPE